MEETIEEKIKELKRLDALKKKLYSLIREYEETREMAKDKKISKDARETCARYARKILREGLRLSKVVYRDLFQAREVFEAYPLPEEQILLDSVHVLRDMSGEVLRHATKKDYEKWLMGYLFNGGKPTHYYDYSFLDEEFYVAKKDFRVWPLYGANSIYIIVPEGIKFLGGELGHIELFFMDGYKSTDWVPVYEDVGNSIITSLEELRELAQSLEIQPAVNHIDTVIGNFKQFIKEEKKKKEEFWRMHRRLSRYKFIF